MIKKIYYKLRIGNMLSLLDRFFWKPYIVMDAKQTIDYIIKTNCSVARFGDGEFNIAAYGCGLGFQKADERLKQRLREVIKVEDDRLLICLPYWAGWDNLLSRKRLEELGPIHQHGIEHSLHDWLKNFNRKRIYGDAHISRVVDTKNFASRREQIEYTKKIWDNRNVVIIEGEKTRFGVQNDLLDNSNVVRRILGPAESAFDCMDELIEACMNECLEMINPIVLLALGPTATVMAMELQRKGIQAIDIGHLDIVYEVTMHNEKIGESAQTIPVPRKYSVPGKYTNEAEGGNEVENCCDPMYLSQIVYKYHN